MPDMSERVRRAQASLEQQKSREHPEIALDREWKRRHREHFENYVNYVKSQEKWRLMLLLASDPQITEAIRYYYEARGEHSHLGEKITRENPGGDYTDETFLKSSGDMRRMAKSLSDFVQQYDFGKFRANIEISLNETAQGVIIWGNDKDISYGLFSHLSSGSNESEVPHYEYFESLEELLDFIAYQIACGYEISGFHEFP